LRDECLTMSWFQNLFDARRKIAAWRTDYNEARPHSSLGYRTPKDFAAAQAAGFDTAERISDHFEGAPSKLCLGGVFVGRAQAVRLGIAPGSSLT